MAKRVLAYIRVSTEEQARRGYSLEAQEQILRDYALGHDLEIVEFFTESHSAYKHGRPVFRDMLKFLSRRKDIAGVLVYKVDRLARNLKDLAEITEMAGKELISATEALPDGATGELIAGIQTSVARYESAKKSERVSLGLETKARKGLWPTYAPTGYNNVGKGIEPDPVAGPLIRELFESYARSAISVKDLTAWARERGLRSRNGCVLARSAVHKILTNPIYYGALPWKGVLYDGRHPPLVSRALFERVQAKLHAGSAPRTARVFHYKGLMTCGYCGCRLTAEKKKGRYIYYHCTESKGKCVQPYYRESVISERLLEVVERVSPPPQIGEKLLELVSDTAEQRSRDRKARLISLKSEAQRLAELRDDAYLDKLQKGITEERWVAVDTRLAGQLSRVEDEIGTLEAFREPAVDGLARTLELLERAPELYYRQDHAERAAFLKNLASNCIITADSLVPVYRKPFAAVAEGLRSGNWLGEEDSNPH